MKEHLKCSDGSPVVVDDVAKTDLVNEYFAVFLPQRILLLNPNLNQFFSGVPLTNLVERVLER